ncbi:protein kinase domain-containing protein [Ditylenchus destructor]|nr:protein kinase domain-containing protein [Ditylenchus destructor]
MIPFSNGMPGGVENAIRPNPKIAPPSTPSTTRASTADSSNTNNLTPNNVAEGRASKCDNLQPASNGGSTENASTSKVRFYRNGDQFFKGLWYTPKVRSWDALLEDLNQHLCDSISLPHGVRYIFSAEGHLITGLDVLEHGHSYVCSSTDKFKHIDYANASQPMWSFVSSKLMSVPPKRGIRATFEREPNDFVRPRIITIIRNGLKPRRVVRHLLNKRTAQSFEHVMQDITAIVKLNSGVVRKLYGLSGKQVTGLADFFGDDHVFVAYGPEKMSVDDFYVISEEYKRMNIISGGCRNRHKRGAPAKMPVRNDGFQKTLSPDPRTNISQTSKLPTQLENSVKIVDLLGDGNTALVFKALFRESNNGASTSTPDALKIISKESAAEMLDFVQTEVQILSEIKYEFIVQMREYHVIDDAWYIRMELLEEGDLFEYLRNKRVLRESDAASCISCLSKALDHLHNRNIVHRDVKPENLLTYKCPDTGLLKLKLADFGLACKVAENELLYHLCGTPTYVAPEVLAEFGYSYKADCWSAGIILYILLCGYPPFGCDEEEVLFGNILRGEFDFPSPSFDDTSYAARLLIRCLLCTEPETRYSAKQVMDYFWIKNPGHTTPEDEEECMTKLSDLMASFDRHNAGEFEESDTEYFYSRRASMDEFSDCGGQTNHLDSVEENGEPVDEPRQRPESSRELSRSSFVFSRTPIG